MREQWELTAWEAASAALVPAAAFRNSRVSDYVDLQITLPHFNKINPPEIDKYLKKHNTRKP